VLLCSSLAFASSLAYADAAEAQRIDGPRLKPRIINGVPTSDFPSVGALLHGGDPATAEPNCTGTMIGCETMLTAAHCVDFGPGDQFTVFLPHAGFFSVASVAINPDAGGPDTYRSDLAVLKLGAPVSGIRPSRLNTLGAVPDGTRGTIVGHGLVLASELGPKNQGQVTTAPCPSFDPPVLSPAGALCWSFEKPYGPPGANSTVCNGDSGGPIFVDLGAGPAIAGVASGILSRDGTARCIPPQYGVEAPVDQFLSWIESEGGPDLANLRCGAVVQVGDGGTSVSAFSGTLAEGTPDARHELVVPANAVELRVTMAGATQFFDDGRDFDLYVKAGSPPTTTDFDCAQEHPSQFAACSFMAPAAGTWHVLVHRNSGAGSYQVTATAFGRDCTQPGTDGLACDDQNPCTAADVCASGVCGGSVLPDATPCDDGDPCSGPDTCDAGACIGAALTGTPCDDGDRCSFPDTCTAGACSGPSPAVGCTLSTVPGGGKLALRDDDRDAKDALGWSWTKGGATSLAALGNPTTTTDYAVCAYDRNGGTPARVLDLPIPAGAGWRASATGFKFKNDADYSRGAITALSIRSGAAGKAAVSVKGKSRFLAMPDLPLAKDPSVLVQLVNPNACWEASFSNADRNDEHQFKARAD
jgi:hypothetical protein